MADIDIKNGLTMSGLYHSATISVELTKALGLYDSLVFSRIKDIISHSEDLGLKSKFVSNVIPKHCDKPVDAWWTKFQLKRVAKLLPFLSIVTVKRHANNLERKGLIYCSSIDVSSVDSTCWYCINSQKLYQMSTKKEAKQ